VERQLSAEAGREVCALKTNHVTNTFVLSLLIDLDFICYSSFQESVQRIALFCTRKATLLQ